MLDEELLYVMKIYTTAVRVYTGHWNKLKIYIRPINSWFLLSIIKHLRLFAALSLAWVCWFSAGSCKSSFRARSSRWHCPSLERYCSVSSSYTTHRWWWPPSRPRSTFSPPSICTWTSSICSSTYFVSSTSLIGINFHHFLAIFI